MIDPEIPRRAALRILSASAAAALLASCGNGETDESTTNDDATDAGAPEDADGTSTVESDQNLLPIPPLILDDGAGISLVASRATTEFFEGAPTETWGFNQPFLGPTVRVRTGDSVDMFVTNELDEAVTAHWHGLEVPGEDDGGAMSHIDPGETWTPTLDINQPATTSWYHSHVHERTGAQVYRGLAGLFIIDDDESDAHGLPLEYGVDDIPLILQDRTFTDTGELDYDITASPGGMVFYGETILVNGAVNPVVQVPAGLVRFRMLNAANGRFFDVNLDDGSTMQLIAADGGFLNEPAEVESLEIYNGQRREIVVDFSAFSEGTEVVLQSRNLNDDDGIMDDTFPLVTIRVSGTNENEYQVPAVLNDNPTGVDLLASVEVAAERSFTMRGGPGGINGEVYAHGVINHTSQLDDWELWSCSGQHPFHVHGASFLVVSRQGDLRPEDSAWQDTVWGGDQPEFLIRFRHEATETFPFMYHCHIFGHEDAGMMGQFTVI